MELGDYKKLYLEQQESMHKDMQEIKSTVSSMSGQGKMITYGLPLLFMMVMAAGAFLFNAHSKISVFERHIDHPQLHHNRFQQVSEALDNLEDELRAEIEHVRFNGEDGRDVIYLYIVDEINRIENMLHEGKK